MPKTPKKTYPCPECGEMFKNWQSRWYHRRDKHGVKPKKPGQWKPKGSKRNAAISKAPSEPQNVPHTHEAPQDTISRVQADIENAINFTAGRCQQLIEDFARTAGIPSSLLAHGVADLLHPQESRQARGAEHRLSIMW